MSRMDGLVEVPNYGLSSGAAVWENKRLRVMNYFKRTGAPVVLVVEVREGGKPAQAARRVRR
jgi:hypothetical protein